MIEDETLKIADETLNKVLKAFRNGFFNSYDHYYSNSQIDEMVESRPLTRSEFLALFPDQEGTDQFDCYGSKFLELILLFSNSEEDRSSTSMRAKHLIDQIETNLHELTIKSLKEEFGDNWWYEGIPEKTRIKAAEMHEMREGKVKKEDCLMLLCSAKIIISNWGLFKEQFDPTSAGRRAFESSFYHLNETRNRISHPIRLRREPVEQNELEELEKWLELTQEV